MQEVGPPVEQGVHPLPRHVAPRLALPKPTPRPASVQSTMAGIATFANQSFHVLGTHSPKSLLLNPKPHSLPSSARNTHPVLSLMNKHIPKAPEQLRIWQQNTHKSQTAQDYVINTARPEDW